MAPLHSRYSAAQQPRWLRPDAHRWVRPDAAKFLKPGTDPADVYPALARAAQDRALADALDCERAVLGALRGELADVDVELKREALRTKADRAFDRVMTVLHTTVPTAIPASTIPAIATITTTLPTTRRVIVSTRSIVLRRVRTNATAAAQNIESVDTTRA
jgi:hypothetical protein